MTNEELVQKAIDLFHGYDIRIDPEPEVLHDEDGTWVQAWLLVAEEE